MQVEPDVAYLRRFRAVRGRLGCPVAHPEGRRTIVTGPRKQAPDEASTETSKPSDEDHFEPSRD